jgi:hypothetical protein
MLSFLIIQSSNLLSYVVLPDPVILDRNHNTVLFLTLKKMPKWVWTMTNVGVEWKIFTETVLGPQEKM